MKKLVSHKKFCFNFPLPISFLSAVIVWGFFCASNTQLAQSAFQNRPFKSLQFLCLVIMLHSPFVLLFPIILAVRTQSCCPFFVHHCHQAAFSLLHQIQLPPIPSSHPFHLFPFTQDSSPHPTLNYYLHSALAHLSLLEALLGTGSILFQIINGAGNPWWEAEFHISSTALQKYSITVSSHHGDFRHISSVLSVGENSTA